MNSTEPLNETPGRPIRVGLVVHVMQVAGAEMIVAETVRSLSDRIAATIFCLDDVGQLGHGLLGEGFDVVCLGRKPGVDLRVAAKLASEVRRRRIEVLHAHQYTPFFYSALARLLGFGGPKLILTEHGRHFPDIVSARRRGLNRILLARLASATTACCEFSRKALVELDGFPYERTKVVENGIDLSRYGRAQHREQALVALGLDPARRYVAVVARLHPIKDHETLLKGFARATARLGDVDLLVVGDGELRERLEGLTRELEVSDRVQFLGVRSDVPELLAAVDLFALTSLSEAASLTILESMASALPVVVTNVGGNPEMVTDGVHGKLVERGDSEAVARAIETIFKDPDLASRMGREGRALVERRYQLRQTIDCYHLLYSNLAAQTSDRTSDGEELVL